MDLFVSAYLIFCSITQPHSAPKWSSPSHSRGFDFATDDERMIGWITIDHYYRYQKTHEHVVEYSFQHEMIGLQKSEAQKNRNISQTDVSLKTRRFWKPPFFSVNPPGNSTMTQWYHLFLDDGCSR